MRIPKFDTAAKAALTLAVAATVAALPGSANAAAPVAVNDSAQTTREAAKVINVLGNDTSLDAEDVHTVVVASDPTSGTVTCTNAGACTYTPENDFTGTDSFTYTVSDGTDSDTGTVTVTVVEISSISLGLTPGSVVWSTAALADNTVTATGTVRRSSTVFLENVPVELWYRPSGTSTYSQFPGTAAKPSNANGRVTWDNLELTSRATLQLRAAGTERSNLRTVVVTPSLTVNYTSKKHALGQSFDVSGSSAPATAGDPVRLERRTSTGAWELVEATTFGTVDSETHSADYAFTTLTHEASGAFGYRVVVPDSLRGRPEVVSSQATVKTYDAVINNVDPTNSDEWVAIKNTGNVAFNLQGWTLSDGDSTVTLPKRGVGAGDIVKVYSGRGTNNATRFYLRKTDRFWESDSTITLKDALKDGVAGTRVVMDVYPH